MNAVDAAAKEHNNLQLNLSPNLSLSVTTTSEVTRDADARIKLVKDEFKQVGSHKLLRKSVIQLTASEHSQLKSSFESIYSFISFVNKNVKQTTTASDGTHIIKPLKLPPLYSRAIKLDGNQDPKVAATNCKRIGQVQRRIGGCLHSTSTNKSQGQIPNKTQVW